VPGRGAPHDAAEDAPGARESALRLSACLLLFGYRPELTARSAANRQHASRALLIAWRTQASTLTSSLYGPPQAPPHALFLCRRSSRCSWCPTAPGSGLSGGRGCKQRRRARLLAHKAHQPAMPMYAPVCGWQGKLRLPLDLCRLLHPSIHRFVHILLHKVPFPPMSVALVE